MAYMVMIALNSRAREEMKEVKGKYGVWGEEVKGEYGVWGEEVNPYYRGMVQPRQQGWVRIGNERYENSGSVLGRHPDRGYKGGRRSPTL